MELIVAKSRVSLGMKIYEWDNFKMLISRIWNEYDLTDYPAEFQVLSELMDIPEIAKTVVKFKR